MISSSLMSFKLCAVAATALVCDDESRFWRRAECLRPGRFRVNANSAPYVDHGGEGSFSSYRDGTWHNRTADGAWTYALRGASAGCAIQPLSLELLTSVLRGVRGARAGDAGDAAVRARDGPHKLVYVGDSLTVGQVVNLLEDVLWRGLSSAGSERRSCGKTCDLYVNEAAGIHVSMVRSDKLGMDSKWVKHVCEADLAQINTGAHFHDVAKFESKLREGLSALERTCGGGMARGAPRIFFRTTSEGNPLCNSKEAQYLKTMDEWDHRVWGVLNGSLPPPDPCLFSRGWHWERFMEINAVASSILPAAGITVLDVVPATRLRPSLDWTARKGKPLDCLHGSRAVAYWNDMLINAAAALVCGEIERVPYAPAGTTFQVPVLAENNFSECVSYRGLECRLQGGALQRARDFSGCVRGHTHGELDASELSIVDPAGFLASSTCQLNPPRCKGYAQPLAKRGTLHFERAQQEKFWWLRAPLIEAAIRGKGAVG